MQALIKLVLVLAVSAFAAGCTATLNDAGVAMQDARVKSIGR